MLLRALTALTVFLAGCGASQGSPSCQEELNSAPASEAAKGTSSSAVLSTGGRKSVISCSQSDILRLDLDEGMYLYLAADQSEVDLVLSFSNPAGTEILTEDKPTGLLEPEELHVVASATGSHTLKIRCWGEEAASRPYSLELRALRRASEEDRERAVAAALTAQAEESRRRQRANPSWQEAERLYLEAVEIWENLADTHRAADTRFRVARLYREFLREPRRAVPHYEAALAGFRVTGNSQRQGDTLFALGQAYLALSRPQEAALAWARALDIFRSTRNAADQAVTLNELGLATELLGDVQQALSYYDQSLALSLQLGDRRSEATARHNRGLLLGALGKTQEALDDLEAALHLRSEVAEPKDRVATLTAIANIRTRTGRHIEAAQLLSSALELRRELGDHRGEAVTLTSLGIALRYLGRVEEAVEAHREALRLLESVADEKEAARARQNLGWSLVDAGRPFEASSELRRALVAIQELKDPELEAASLFGLARASRRMGDLEAAWAWMQRALRQVESVRTRLLNRDLRTSYLATKQRYYEFSIDLLMELHQGHRAMGFDAKALSISERARARALLDLLQESEVEINGQTPLSLLTRERELGRAIRESREALDRVGGAASETSAATTRKELRGLLRDYETAKAEVRRASPRSRASLVAPPLSSGEIQHRVLDEKTLLLQYELGDERSFLWTVSPDSFVSFVLPARDEIENLARQAHELLSSRDQRKWEGKRQATLHRLSEILLAPVANHLGESRLLIVADGALLLLPFGALPDPLAEPLIRDNLDYPVPLLVHHEVVTLPSASSAAMLEQRSSARSPAPELLAIVADPVFDREDSRVHASPLLMATASVATPWSSGTFQRLSYSREEALGIAAEAIERPFLALDFDANRQAIVREGFDRYRILHLATHGEIDTEYPLLSRLVLSLVDDSGRPLDGYLYAHEIYELHLPAELVVLSACETALGKEIQGEGLVGLPHAFLYAGANRVVVSLWKVHDRSTADLMVRFYRHLLSGGESPVSALRAAQIESWERAPWNHGWAAFVFQGLWSWDDSKPKSRSRAPTL